MARWFSLPSRVGQRLDAAVGESVDGRRVRNGVLHVDSPRTGVRGTWAHGIADPPHGAPMRPDSPVLSASVGKIVMAATASLLEQKGALSIDGPSPSGYRLTTFTDCRLSAVKRPSSALLSGCLWPTAPAHPTILTTRFIQRRMARRVSRRASWTSPIARGRESD